MHYIAASLLILLTLAGGTWAVLEFPEAVTRLGLVEQHEPDGPEALRLAAIARDPTHRPAGEAGSHGAGDFDVAKVEPNGTSVFAGRSRPNTFVTVLADGVPIGTARSDLNGEWVLVVERRFANADPKLSIEIGTSPARQSIETAAAEIAPGRAPSAASVTAQLIEDLQRRVDRARAAEASRWQKSEPAAADAAATSEARDQERTAAPDGRDTGSEAAGERERDRAGDAVAVAAAAPTADRTAARPEAEVVPVPIQFVFREAEFTAEGRKAVQLLLEYARLTKRPQLRLTGHADERGTHAFNLDLSAERLEAVARFLRAGGYDGGLELIPKGDTEPYMRVDRSLFPREQLYDLDRRVELHLVE